LRAAIPSFKTPQIRLNAVAFLFYAGLAFLVLHSILFQTGNKVAGFDFFNYNWNFWWIRHALTTPGLNVYENNFAMFPFTTNYGYHALTMVWYPLWALLEPLIGTLAAVNVIILLGCVLNGWLFFLLLRRERVGAGLALIAGAALQISPILRYFYYNTHLNLMDWFWLPAQLLLWQQIVRTVEAGKLKRAVFWAVVQGITFWGVLHTDLQFPIFTSFLLLPYVLYTLWRSRKRLQLIIAGIVVALVAAPLAWFFGPLPYILRFSGTLTPGTVEDRPGIPFPDGFLSMSREWWQWTSPSLGAFVSIVFLLTLLVALLALRKRFKLSLHWRWFLSALPPLLFVLGPNITIAGNLIPMPPFRLLYDQTNGMFRMPWRLAPIFIIATLIFVCKAWSPYFRRITTARIFALALLFLLLTVDVRLFESAPLDPAPTDYAFYHQIGSEQGAPYDDEVVLEVPNGAATGELIIGDQRATQLQFYGMTHHKRMVNGFISRAPLENYWYMLTDDPMLSWLGQRRLLDPTAVREQLQERIFDWHIGYIVVHRDLIGRDSSTVQEILGFFNAQDDLLCPYTVEGDAIVYRTRWHPDGCPPRTPTQTALGVFTLDIGTPGDEGFLGSSWYYPENIFGTTLRWIGMEAQNQLYLDLPLGAYQLTLSAQAYQQPRSLRLLVNDSVLENTVTVTEDALHEYTFDIPEQMLGDGKNVKLTLQYDTWSVPAEIGQGSDTRKLSIALDWLRFTRQTTEQQP
jgi:hypothetical protein